MVVATSAASSSMLACPTQLSQSSLFSELRLAEGNCPRGRLSCATWEEEVPPSGGSWRAPASSHRDVSPKLLLAAPVVREQGQCSGEEEEFFLRNPWALQAQCSHLQSVCQWYMLVSSGMTSLVIRTHRFCSETLLALYLSL